MVSGTLSTGLTPRTSTKTKTRLAPVSMQGLEVLALPVASLPDRIASMAESNPLLEINYEDDLFSYDALPSESAFEEAKERAEAKHTTLRVGRLLAIRLESRAQPSGTFLASRMIA